MADLSDLVSDYSSDKAGTKGKANLLDYANDTEENIVEQEAPRQQMMSEDQASSIAQQRSIAAMQDRIMPGTSELVQRDEQALMQSGIDPELIFESNAEKFGKSLVAGTGIVVSDIGNMIDYVSMTILPEEARKSDTFLSITERLPSFHQWGESLQKWGETHQSPGLDEFTLDDMFKLEFWATDVAKTLPYMASMIIPGKLGVNVFTGLAKAGARGAAKQGMFGSAKRLVKTRSASETAKAAAKGSSKAVSGAEATLGGEGLMGALATTTAEGTIGLSSLGSGIAAFLGSATASTAVIGAGLAGDVYNRAVSMGMSEEEANEAAHGTFVDNSKWFLLNGLSWGVQFGGLSGKAFQQFNKMRGGAESAKVIQRNFGQRLMQHARRGAAAGTFEGTEEMFQETYETWIQEKNLAEAQGKEFVEYTDFLTSEENRKTLGVSFAAGFLMGGRGGFMNSVAENGRRITNKRVSIDEDINAYENMSEAQRKVRTNEIIEAAIREDQVDGLNGMLDKLQKAGKISSEERAEYDNIIMEYSKIAASLPFQEKLTEAGQQTLFNIKVKELQSKKSLENLEVLKNKNIKEANENLEGESLSNELAKIENEHNMNVEAVNKSIAEGKTAIANLLSAKKYTSQNKANDTKKLKEINEFEKTEEYNSLSDAEKSDLSFEKESLQSKLEEDSYAIDEANQVVDGLTEEEFEQFTKEGEVEKAEREKQEAESKVDKVSEQVEEGVEKAAETGKGILSKAKSFTGRAVDFVKQKFADVKKRQEFRKAMRPFDAQIQELQKEGKTTKEILEAIKPNIDVENISDNDLELYINTVTGVAEKEAEADETTDEPTATKTEDETTEEEAPSGEQVKEEKAQSSDTKAKKKADVDADISFAQKAKNTADKIAKSLSKKAYKAKKKITKENIKGLFKEGFGKIPKMKTGVEKKQSVLQYYSTINPVLESSIISAASKKFPDKQLLILREVIDEHGSEVAGMALGSAVQVQAGQDVGIKIMHEYGHVYYNMMKDNPSFKRGVSKIIGSKIFRDTKNLYSEELLYKSNDGSIVRGDEVFAVVVANKDAFPQEIQQDIEAFFTAQKANDLEAGKAVFDKVINKLQEDKAISLLPDSEQEAIIEEAFVTSLAPQMAGQLNILFDKSNDVVQYEGFLKRLRNRVAKMITPSDAKDILKNVDRKFENMSLEEIGNEIINDISTGVNGSKFKSAKPKYMKFGKLSKQVAPIASMEINKQLLSTDNVSFETIVENVLDSVAEQLSDPDIKDSIREEISVRVASEISAREGNTLNPDGKKSEGVRKVYEEAGYDTAKVEEETLEDSYIDPEESIEQEEENGINITSDDASRQAAMQNSSSEFMKALMMIANPRGQNRQYEKVSLEAAVFNLAKANRDNVARFIKSMNSSNDPHIVKALEIMNKYMSPLEVMHVQREFHKNFSNKFMESITNTVIKSDGNVVQSESLASSEESKIKSITNAANKVFFKLSKNDIRKDVANRLDAAKEKVDNGGKITTREALFILAPMLHMSDSSMYLDMNALASVRIPVQGKQYSIEKFVESFVKSKSFNDYSKKGQISIKNPHITSLIETMVIKSRGKNMIKTVNNVNGKKTMTLSMNSHLLNAKETLEKMASTEDGRDQLLDKYPGNPFIKMVVALGQKGLAHEAFKLSIDGGTVSLMGRSKSVAYQNKTKQDILFGDLESFVSSYDNGKPGDSRTYYSQPISIFSNSKRRYSIQAPMATTSGQKQKVLEEIKKNKLDKQLYKDKNLSEKERSVLGFKISGSKGKYKVDLSEQNKAVKSFIEQNPGVLQDNPLLSQIAEVDKNGNVKFSKEGEKIIDDFNFNFIVNSLYAQKLFVGEHTQAKSQSDFVKRATGAIARHDGSLRGVAIEPIIIKDVLDETGFEESNAGAFILPEDVSFIQDRVGPRMGQIFKFVHYGNDKRGDNANDTYENEDIYLKTAVFVLHPEAIGESEVLQNIADKLKARRNKNGYGESLNIAVFESGAKKFPGIHNGESSIEHDAEFGPDSEAQKQLDSAYMIGDKLVGIDGANMGIQLPMDKDKKSVNVPSQHIGNTNNDLTAEEALQVDEIQALESEIFDTNLEEAVGTLISDAAKSTPESRKAAKEMLGNVIGRNAIRSVANGTAKMIAASNPNISQNLPGLHKYFNNAIRSLIKKSSKIITNGTIGIQSTSVGRGLKAYTQGTRFNSNGERRKVTLAAEAIVPAALKGKYLARVDQDNNGNKFNSSSSLKSFIDNNMVSIASSKGGGIRVKGLNRIFDTELQAKEFLYNQMAQLSDGSYVILGEEFLGSRIPAHGNQSRVVMEVKGFQHEVKGKDGNFQNNSIQVPAEVNKVLGADHDGDSIFMNFRYDNPKTDKQRKTNEYLRKTIEFYEQPARFEEITADLEITEEVDARLDAIKKKFPNRSVRQNQNSPVGAAEFFEENVTGSGMVGNVAALNVGLSYLSRYGVNLGFSVGVDGESINDFNNNYEGDYKSSALSFQSAKTLQIVLDNAKNQQATTLGLNPSTIVAGTVLPRIGFNPSKVDLILNSQGAKLYSKYAGKKALRDRNFVYTSPAEAAIAELTGDKARAKKIIEQVNQKPELPVNINTELISETPAGINNSKIENEIEVIKLMHKMEGVGQDVYLINTLMGTHKTVPTNSQETQELLDQVNDLFNEDSSVRGTTSLRNLKSNPVVKSFQKKLDTLKDIYDKNQLSGTWHANDTFTQIKNMVGGHNLFASDGNNVSKLISDYNLNIITNYAPKISNAIGKYAKTKDGVINPTNLAEKLQRLHGESLASEDRNEFMHAVSITKHEGFVDPKTGNQVTEDKFSLRINKDYINEHTRPFEIQKIKSDFAKLSPELQEMFIAADAILNSGGQATSSVSLLFDDRTLVAISKSIDSKHQEILNETTGALADPKTVAEAIVIENPDIVPTAQRVYKDKNGKKQTVFESALARIGEGGKEMKLLNITADIQKTALRTNSPHYVKIQDGSTILIYKWKPAPSNKFDAKNWLGTSKKFGKYTLVGTTKKGAKTNISNLTKMERAARSREALTSLITSDKTVPRSAKMKFSNSKSGSEQGFTDSYKQFTFEEYVADKGFTVSEVNKNKSLKETLDKLYEQYQSNFNLAQEFDRNIVQTGKLSGISEGRLTDYALLFQKLDPSAISGAHKAVVIELAKRAGEEQKASRNGIEWTDKGDISWLHAWFGSNNISGNRPEIQKLVREMEKEYSKFMDENIKFQKELDRLTKNLIRDRLGEENKVVGGIWNFTRWIAGGLSENQNSKVYGNMYDKVTTVINGKKVPELKLKSKSDFLRTKPSQAEKEFYNFFVETTKKYGNITKKALGERFKEGYIPHLQTSLKESIRQRGLLGLYDYMLQGTGDIDNVRVKGVDPVSGKTVTMPFHEWKYVFYTEKGIKKTGKREQFKAASNLDAIRRRAEKLAKSGKHEDGKPISRTEQEIHGVMGTNLMSRFTKSRGVKAAMFGSQDLGRALSQYVNTTLFTYGNENFRGFKQMTPLLDGVIRYNKEKGNKNAVTYLENVWKKGFYNLGESQTGLGRLADSAIHKLVKLTRIRYLGLSFGGGFGNLVVGKYNEFRSKGGKNFARGEARYWGQRKKSWAIIKKHLNPESFAYDLIQGNNSSGFDSIMMAPYIGSEHYIQGSGLVSQFTEEEWSRISEEGTVPEDLQDKVDLYVDNVVRQQGYGYSKVDQIGIATYSWGKAIMQFKKWIPTAVTERFQKETVDRFGQMRAGSNATAFVFGAKFARDLMSGKQSMKDFRKEFNKLPEHKKEAVKTFFRGMQVVSVLTAMSMILGESDDDDLRSMSRWADNSVDDIMFLTDPRRYKRALEPASWSLVESGAKMATGAATLSEDRFISGLRGVSWTAAQVLSESKN